MAGGKKLFLDTNVWLRYALKDELTQYGYVCQLLERIERGDYLPYISSLILLEIYFILSHYYKRSPKDINKYFDYILSVRNMVVIEKTNIKTALNWHGRLKIKLPDCLIASSMPKRCTMVSWDKDFLKIKDIKTLTPKDLIK